MEFLDCNLTYGPDTTDGQLPGCGDIGALWRQLDRAGISGGLVVYAFEEPILANETLARDLQTAPAGLKGVWTLLPSCTGEIAAPADLPALMKRNNIAALTMNPQMNYYLPRRHVIGDYLEMASERAIPVLLNTGRGLRLEQIDDIMNDFPNLTAVLSYAQCWPSDRWFRPLLDAYPNLYYDMSYMQTAAGLPDLVKRYTARRILFGSAYPEQYAGALMMVIKHADIGADDKALVAGGNLKRLLEEARYD